MDQIRQNKVLCRVSWTILNKDELPTPSPWACVPVWSALSELASSSIGLLLLLTSLNKQHRPSIPAELTHVPDSSLSLTPWGPDPLFLSSHPLHLFFFLPPLSPVPPPKQSSLGSGLNAHHHTRCPTASRPAFPNHSPHCLPHARRTPWGPLKTSGPSHPDPDYGLVSWRPLSYTWKEHWASPGALRPPMCVHSAYSCECPLCPAWTQRPLF